MSLAKKRDIVDSMWSVFTSFGFCEVEKENGEKFCIFEKNEARAVNVGGTVKAKAETAALVIETAIANGLDNFTVSVGESEVFELLELFGFEKIINLDENEKSFSAKCDDIEFAKGDFEENRAECIFYIDKFMDALTNEGVDMSDSDVSASLVFAEKDAEGIAYDIAYNLRVNGCIVEYYNEDGDIYEAEEYAKKKNISCILRAFADGTLMMKDLIKDEIIKTTAAEFLGYYEEDEEECDCGCGHDHHHHHGEDCDCHAH